MGGDAVEFLVLGPLEARSARETLSLGGPRQRAVLADLVLHAGSVVAMDTLIDDLWAATPPVTAEAIVQNAISRHRKTLGRDAIETRAPGYVLAVDPGAIDARRFERLVRDARPLPAAERSAALRDALALWRGPAYADLAFESFLQDEIARLDELRLTAMEDGLDAEIELGRHDAVVAEASALRDRHPARERLCRLLMLALHRAGRQQEALDAYEVLRRTLDEQFGLEPSPETRALQLMILNQDPAIAVGSEPPPSIGAVRRPVALLLVELLLDEELELEAAGSALADARRALAELVARHGGSLSSESGVELVAAFGAEAAHEDDVLRAARSAVELHEVLAGRDIDARLAVGTGRVLVEDGRPVLVGSVVGQTRRALHEAEAGDILVTPAAARLGGDALELDADGRLLGVRPGRPRSMISSAPLVGRSAELVGLRAAFDRVVETARPEHVVVVGEAGIGKSRLVAAFVGDVRATVLEAACVPYGEGISFLPLCELAERATALDERAPELGDLSSADAALAAARGLFEHFTASGPLVVALDDLHWAVPTFLDLVEYVVRAVHGPLLVVSATRPELLEQRPAWGHGATMLQPLPGDDARCLVDALPEREALDDKSATAILDAAEGVPLFLEQLAAYAAESGLGDEIPSSLEALLASCIDALELGERDVLSRAAIVGRAFSRESIGALTPDDELREIDGRLASLGRRRFVRPRVGEHEFVHPLVLAAAYRQIPRKIRADLHERYARRLPDGPASDATAGTHLERAVVDLRASGIDAMSLATEAADRLGRAGSLARRIGDASSARDLAERGLRLLPDEDPRALPLVVTLGAALKDLGLIDDAVDALAGVARRAADGGFDDIGAIAEIEQVWPRLMRNRSTIDDSLRTLDRCSATLGSRADPFDLARLHHVYATVLGDFAGRNDDAHEHARRADGFYREAGMAAVDVVLVGSAVAGSMPLHDARALADRHLAATSGLPKLNSYLALQVAYLDALLGDADRARNRLEAAQAQLLALGDEFGRTTVAVFIAAEVELVASCPETARDLLDAAIDGLHDPQGSLFLGWLFALRALVAAELGDNERASDLAESAVAVIADFDVRALTIARRAAARAAAAGGQLRKAARIAKTAVEGISATDCVIDRAVAHLDLAEVFGAAGREGDAHAEFALAVGMLKEKGARAVLTAAENRFATLFGDAPGSRALGSPGRAR